VGTFPVGIYFFKLREEHGSAITFKIPSHSIVTQPNSKQSCNVSSFPFHQASRNSYDVKESGYSSDCPNLIRSFIENRTQATDRDSLNKLDICKFFNAVAKLRNQGFNGDLETLLAVLKGEATLKLSSKSQEVKETLADNKLSVIIRRELT
jgi:hypothetical protein